MKTIISISFVLLTSAMAMAEDAVPNNDASRTFARPRQRLGVHIFSGYSGYPGISDGGPVVGFEFVYKNASFNDLRVPGNWEGGLYESIAFGQRQLTTIDLSLGYGLADDNKFTVGVLGGITFLNKYPNTGFFAGDYFIGPSLGLKASYLIPLFGNLYLTPMATGNIAGSSNIPFFYSINLSISYVWPFVSPRK